MMIIFIGALVILSSISFQSPIQAHSHTVNPSKTGQNEELREELLSMLNEDQKIRRRLIFADTIAKMSIVIELDELRKKLAMRLMEIIDIYGWPGYRLVGAEGSHAAYVIALHADYDVYVQKQFLLHLARAAKDMDASTIDVAHLTDRTLINEGKLQRFGTQVEIHNDIIVPREIEDRENLDKRRIALGLEPFEEFLNHVQTMYEGRNVLL